MRHPAPENRAPARTVLGRALTALGWAHEPADHLADAVAADRFALKATSRENLPERLGLIQYWMGFALRGLGALARQPSHLVAAPRRSCAPRSTCCPPATCRRQRGSCAPTSIMHGTGWARSARNWAAERRCAPPAPTARNVCT
jgi:hypothetical protein